MGKHMGTKTGDGKTISTRNVRTRIQLRGLSQVDKRFAAAKSLIAWRDAVVADLGGEENLTAMKRAVVEEATRAKLFLDHVDQYLLSLDTVIDKRSRRVRAIVEQRMRVGEHLMKQMDRLGLERQMKAVSPNFDITWKGEEQSDGSPERADEVSVADPAEQGEAQGS
jgi:hypothetical protein